MRGALSGGRLLDAPADLGFATDSASSSSMRWPMLPGGGAVVPFTGLAGGLRAGTVTGAAPGPIPAAAAAAASASRCRGEMTAGDGAPAGCVRARPAGPGAAAVSRPCGVRTVCRDTCCKVFTGGVPWARGGTMRTSRLPTTPTTPPGRPTSPTTPPGRFACWSRFGGRTVTGRREDAAEPTGVAPLTGCRPEGGSGLQLGRRHLPSREPDETSDSVSLPSLPLPSAGCSWPGCSRPGCSRPGWGPFSPLALPVSSSKPPALPLLSLDPMVLA